VSSRIAIITRLAKMGIAVPGSFMSSEHLQRTGLDLPAGALTREELHALDVTVPSAYVVQLEALQQLEAHLVALLDATCPA
jgi:hypothetical protein